MRKKQFYDKSCGAAALLCAASELGITRLPDIPDTMITGQDLRADNACESALYYLTCGATIGPRPLHHDLTKGGYSFPHNVVLAARIIGLEAKIYMEGRWTPKVLSLLYPRCGQLSTQSGIPIVHGTPPKLEHSERRLRIMGVMKFVGLHYVMERPDGTYMDPADGHDFPSCESMNNSWLKCYADTGISIVFRKAHLR